MTVRLRKQQVDIHLQPTGQQGGEGFQCAVQGHPQWWAKIYHQPPADLEARLELMLEYPPFTIIDQLAWPLDIVEEHGGVAGYLQPHFAQRIPAAELTTTSAPAWATQPFYAQVASEICLLTAELHAERYLFPDLHLGQFLIHRNEPVVLVDTASCQFRRHDQFFACTSVVPDVQAPELLGTSDWLAVADQRDEYTDAWSLAIIVFQLAMRAHPFDGIDIGGGATRSRFERMQDGIFPYAPHGLDAQPPKYALPYAGIRPEIRALFERCFIAGHADRTQRPLAGEWADTLRHLPTLRLDSGKPPQRPTPRSGHATQPTTETGNNWLIWLLALLILWRWWTQGDSASTTLAAEWWRILFP